MSYDTDVAVAGGIFFGTIALFILLIIGATKQMNVERRCLALGYPSGVYQVYGPEYCIKRVNQTDSVVVLR